MSKTIEQLAQEALDVQSACNLCGVVQSFARAMVDLGEHVKGTDARNSHPISVLWADKVAHLAGIQDIGNDATMKAYGAAYDIVASAGKRPASSWNTPHLGIVLADDSEVDQ
jgi:hypothetical protein